MKRFFAIAIALVALTGFSTACSDDDVVPLTLNSVAGGAVSSGANEGVSTSHWESVGTSSIELKVALYEDGTCEVVVSGSLYDSVNLDRGGRYDCTFVVTGLDSIDLTVDGKAGDVTVELTDIEYNDEADTWTVTINYEDGGEPAASALPIDATMMLIDSCNIAGASTESSGCSV